MKITVSLKDESLLKDRKVRAWLKEVEDKLNVEIEKKVFELFVYGKVKS
jgi:hypothetical protein